MRKRRNTKAQNETYHFKKRCDERLGVQIDRKAIQRRIHAQNFDENFYFLKKQSNRVSLYRYKYQEIWYIIPYDKNRHKVITIFEDKKQDLVEEIKIEKISECPTKNSDNWLKRIFEYFIDLLTIE